MQEFIQPSTQSAHFLDHIKGILYLEDGRTFNVGYTRVVEDIHTFIERIQNSFVQAGEMGVDDIIMAAL